MFSVTGIILTLLLPAASFAAKDVRNCAELFLSHTSSVSAPGRLHHVVRFYNQSFGVDPGQFVDMMLRATKSKEALQGWTGTSHGGQIWTMSQGHNELGDSFYDVYFTIDREFNFYDKRGDKNQMWLKWLKKNSRRENRFPQAQVEMLKAYGDPWHSGFYDDNNLAGLLFRYGRSDQLSAQDDTARNAYNLVNMNSVQRIDVKSGGKTEFKFRF